MRAKPDPLNPGLYRLHRVICAVIAVFAAIMSAIGTLMLIQDEPGSGIGLAGLFALPLGALHWFAAEGARGGRASGRVLSRVIGTLWLFGFPAGTLLGLYVWVKTSGKRWRSAEAIRSQPAPNGVWTRSPDVFDRCGATGGSARSVTR